MWNSTNQNVNIFHQSKIILSKGALSQDLLFFLIFLIWIIHGCLFFEEKLELSNENTIILSFIFFLKGGLLPANFEIHQIEWIIKNIYWNSFKFVFKIKRNIFRYLFTPKQVIDSIWWISKFACSKHLFFFYTSNQKEIRILTWDN